jgi:hypothetical protein
MAGFTVIGSIRPNQPGNVMVVITVNLVLIGRIPYTSEMQQTIPIIVAFTVIIQVSGQLVV